MVAPPAGAGLAPGEALTKAPPKATTPAEALYTRLEQVGRGSFGAVYRGIHKLTGDVVAIKVLDLDTDDDEIMDIQKEITLLSNCESPYIIQYRGSYLQGTKLWVIMDYASGGSMRSVLKSGVIEERHIAVIASEVCQALHYLHKHAGIIHRDIKAANILLTEDGRVRLCDFGVAGQISLSCLRRTSFVGTPYWMPPEIIQRSHYDTKADIWSLGITMIELAKGNPPFADQDPRRAIFLIPRSPPARLEEKLFSPALREFVALCLQTNPDLRPTAEELLKTKLVRGASRDPMALQDLLRRHQAWQRSQPPSSGPSLASGQSRGEGGGEDEEDDGEDALPSDDDWVFESIKGDLPRLSREVPKIHASVPSPSAVTTTLDPARSAPMRPPLPTPPSTRVTAVETPTMRPASAAGRDPRARVPPPPEPPRSAAAAAAAAAHGVVLSHGAYLLHDPGPPVDAAGADPNETMPMSEHGGGRRPLPRLPGSGFARTDHDHDAGSGTVRRIHVPPAPTTPSAAASFSSPAPAPAPAAAAQDAEPSTLKATSWATKRAERDALLNHVAHGPRLSPQGRSAAAAARSDRSGASRDEDAARRRGPGEAAAALRSGESGWEGAETPLVEEPAEARPLRPLPDAVRGAWRSPPRDASSDDVTPAGVEASAPSYALPRPSGPSGLSHVAPALATHPAAPHPGMPHPGMPHLAAASSRFALIKPNDMIPIPAPVPFLYMWPQSKLVVEIRARLKDLDRYVRAAQEVTDYVPGDPADV